MKIRSLIIPILALCALSSSIVNAQEASLNELIYSPSPKKGIDSDLKLKTGDTAPEFELQSINGETIRLSDFKGEKQVVITFVPAAWTPVCSAQWPGYSLAIDHFKNANAVILGITVDNIPTLHAWTKAMGGIDFPILSDFYPHGEVAQRYGVLRSDGVSERALFVVDLDGKLKYINVQNINERPPLEDLINALKQ